MSFLLPCPNCGPRDVNEFAYAGEVTRRPKSDPSLRELTSYIYFRRNVAGVPAPVRGSGSSVFSTSFVRVSRSARNQSSQPKR